MRLRRKPWARPELAECSFFVDDPTNCKNRWQQEFGNCNPIMMELGCGKGGFIARMASENTDINYLAIDLKSEVLVLAKRKVEKLYTERNISPMANLRLMSQDIERLDMILGGEDRVERIYINFCNPWPKDRHAKHRLTHTRQLVLYSNFLPVGGELWFKTDDMPLFEDTLEYTKEAGYEIKYITRDLHSSGFSQNIITEHEEMFSSQGIPIKFLIAVNKNINTLEGAE